MSLLLDKAGSAPERRILMKQDTDGVWTVSGRRSWRNARYLYEVTVYAPSTDKVEMNRVTDPYSVALTTNSAAVRAGRPQRPRTQAGGLEAAGQAAAAAPEDS